MMSAAAAASVSWNVENHAAKLPSVSRSNVAMRPSVVWAANCGM